MTKYVCDSIVGLMLENNHVEGFRMQIGNGEHAMHG